MTDTLQKIDGYGKLLASSSSENWETILTLKQRGESAFTVFKKPFCKVS